MSREDRHIRNVLRVKHGDTLPFTGWHKATRRDLAQIFADLGYKSGAEIGVAQGRYSELLCQTIPGLQLYCVDPYSAYERIGQELCDARMAEAHRKLSPYNATFIRKPSIEAVNEIPLESLDFVYIDGRHDFDNVMLDIILWAQRVRKGGIVSGHDYFEFYQAGVTKAVNAYTAAHHIWNWYLTKEKEASWLWVKR